MYIIRSTVHYKRGYEKRRKERKGEQRAKVDGGESAMLVSIFNRHYRRLDCLL
jgi:hypothetical protein